MLPPRSACFCLACAFRQSDLFVTSLAATTLDQHLLHSKPSHRQHQYPVQRPVGAVLHCLAATIGALLRRLFFRRFCRCFYRSAPWLRSWLPVHQHTGQRFFHFPQIVVQCTGCHTSFSSCRLYIDLCQGDPDRLDFFVNRTYPISDGTASSGEVVCFPTFTRGSPFVKVQSANISCVSQFREPSQQFCYKMCYLLILSC